MCKILQSLFLLFIETIIFVLHTLQLFALENPRKPSTGLHVIVFKELIKLHVHPLEVKELILTIFFERKQLTFVKCYFQVEIGLNVDFTSTHVSKVVDCS